MKNYENPRITLRRGLAWSSGAALFFVPAGTPGTVVGIKQTPPEGVSPPLTPWPITIHVCFDHAYGEGPGGLHRLADIYASVSPDDVTPVAEATPEPSQRYVVGFLFYGAEVALVRKAKPAWQCGHLNGVGGKIERRESPAEAMAREFREETGVATEPSDWTEAVVMDGPGWRIHFFSRESGWRPVLVGSEEEPVAWYPVYPLPVHVLPNLRWLIPLVRDKDLDFPVHVRDHTHPVEA